MKISNTVQSIIRHVLTAAGAYLVATGKISEGQSSAVLGAIMAILGVVWGATDEAIAENKTP